MFSSLNGSNFPELIKTKIRIFGYTKPNPPLIKAEYLPDSNGESREGVDCGEDFNAEVTAREVTEAVPFVVPLFPNFLIGLILDDKLNLSEGGGCCLACWRHFARLFLNQT